LWLTKGVPPVPRSRPFDFALLLPQARQERIAAGLGLFWSLLVAAFYLVGFFDDAEDALLDWEQTVFSSTVPDPDFALIAISRVPSDRPWPWPRLDYALALRGLVPEHPQSVVFEMTMHDEDPRFSAFDASFRTLVDRTDAVVFAAAALQAPSPEPLPDGVAALRLDGKPGHVANFGSFLWPVKTFAEGSPVGIANFSHDPSQVLRRVPLVFRLENRIVPSLALTAAATRLGADLGRSELVPGKRIVLRDGDGHVLRVIPVDDEGRLRLRFRKPGLDLLRVNYDDFLLYADQAEREVVPAVDLRSFGKRQVWIGATDPSVSDPIRTAAGLRMPVDIQLQATAQIVRNDLIVLVPKGVVVALLLVSGVLLAYGTERLSLSGAIGVIGGVVASIFAGGVLAFTVGNVAFPLVTYLVLAAGVVFCSRVASAWEILPRSAAEPEPVSEPVPPVS